MRGSGRRAMAVVVTAAAAGVVPTARAAALDPPPTPPAVAPTVVAVSAVDRTARTVVVTDSFFGATGGHRVDRLTGRTTVLPSYRAISADGSAVVTSDGRWLDVDSGAGTALAAAGDTVLLSADGRTYVVGGAAGAPSVVDGPTGRSTPAPVAGRPVALSANARYLVIATACAVDALTGADLCDQTRWDRATGALSVVASRSAREVLLSGVADTGRVLVGAPSRPQVVLVRDPGSPTRPIGPQRWLGGTGELSDDGRTFLFGFVPTSCCGAVAMLDVDTGVVADGDGLGLFLWSRTSLSGPIVGSVRLSGDGSTVVYLTRGFDVAGTELRSFPLPGRSVSARVRAGEALRVPVAGREGVPADASAVALNVTVTDPAAAGFVTVWPCGTARPLASNLNTPAGGTVANAVIARVGSDGAVCLGANVDVNLVVDLQGWFPTGSPYTPLLPARLVDTRAGEDDAVANLAAGTELRVPVSGRAGVGAGAGAVALNVTATNPAAAGFVTVWPCGEPRPLASNLNMDAGQTVAGAVLVGVGDGAVCAWANVATDLVVDVQGWFGPGAGYEPAVPRRLLDSRRGEDDGSPNLPAGEVTVEASVGEEALVLNVTATNPAAAGFVTVWPCDQPRPLASSVNVTAGRTVPNLVLVATGASRRVCTWSNVAVDLVIDRQGAFAGAATFRPLTPVRLLDTRT